VAAQRRASYKTQDIAGVIGMPIGHSTNRELHIARAESRSHKSTPVTSFEYRPTGALGQRVRRKARGPGWRPGRTWVPLAEIDAEAN